MKKLIFTVLILGALSSCKKDDTVSLKEFPQKWQLVKSTGQFPGSETTGSALEWQESYVLNQDGTFLKTREEDGSVKHAGGKYSYGSDGKYLTLNYTTQSNLIGTCNPEYQSELMVIVSATYMKGSWDACDGPKLEYSRVE